MTRQTVSQAVAMLVVIWSLFRWWPHENYRGLPDYTFGRGDPQMMLSVDDLVASDMEAKVRVRGVIRGLVRGFSQLYQARWMELLRHARTVRMQGERADVVHLKGMPGNDWYMLAYYLYPLRCVGDPYEDGGSVKEPTLPEAQWAITGGKIPRYWRIGDADAEVPFPGDEDVGEGVLRESDLVQPAQSAGSGPGQGRGGPQPGGRRRGR